MKISGRDKPTRIVILKDPFLKGQEPSSPGNYHPAPSKEGFLFSTDGGKMHRGYTKRWRKRWDKGYHKDRLLWVMMSYFIDFATYKDKEFAFTWKGKVVEIIKLKRGQCFFTYKGLADFLTGPKNNVSRKMVRERTRTLQKIGFLEHQYGHKYQVVTISNYEKYNPIEDRKEPHSSHQSTINRPLIDHQSTTTNNIKKDNKEKEYKSRAIFPDWIDKDLWNEFKKYRIEIKSPLTDHAEKLCLADLIKLVDGGENQKAVINQTIKSGKWKTFYPENKNCKNDTGNLQKWKSQFSQK